MRAVLDPSVVVSALIARAGPAARLLIAFRSGAFDLVVSPVLLEEVERLVQRPTVRPYVDDAEASAVVDVITEEGVLLDDPPPAERPLGEDPGDEYLIALARAAGARALVTVDPHLTALADRLPILTPSEFLLIVE